MYTQLFVQQRAQQDGITATLLKKRSDLPPQRAERRLHGSSVEVARKSTP